MSPAAATPSKANGDRTSSDQAPKHKATVYEVILAHIRAHARSDFADMIAQWTDEQLIRQMFANYRSGQGLRLTRIGRELMAANFRYYVFAVEEALKPAHLLYLDKHSRMPYYCGPNEIDVFDGAFATRLRLVGGDLKTLMEIDSPYP